VTEGEQAEGESNAQELQSMRGATELREDLLSAMEAYDSLDLLEQDMDEDSD
jgi:hypothetical protein